MLMQSSDKLMRDGRGTHNSDVYWNRSASTLAGLTMDLRAVRVDRGPLCGVRMREALSSSGIVENRDILCLRILGETVREMG